MQRIIRWTIAVALVGCPSEGISNPAGISTVPETTSPSGKSRLNVPVIVLAMLSEFTFATVPVVKKTPEPKPLNVPVP